MLIRITLALAVLATAPAYAQTEAASPAEACLARVQEVDPEVVAGTGRGEVNQGMQQAQVAEMTRLRNVAIEQARQGDAEECRRTFALMEDLLTENRQQLPTQQELATEQPGSPGLEREAEEDAASE